MAERDVGHRQLCSGRILPLPKFRALPVIFRKYPHQAQNVGRMVDAQSSMHRAELEGLAITMRLTYNFIHRDKKVERNARRAPWNHCLSEWAKVRLDGGI